MNRCIPQFFRRSPRWRRPPEAKTNPFLCAVKSPVTRFTTALLLGLGFRRFSVSPGRLLEIKHAIRSIDLTVASAFAANILSLSSVQDIRAQVQEDWNRRRPVSSPDLPSTTPQPNPPPVVTHNENSRRFETRSADGSLSFLDYTIAGDRITFEYTFVPDQLRRKGIAANLTRAALTEARRRHFKVIPRCSYVATFIKRHPEFVDLLDQRVGNLD